MKKENFVGRKIKTYNFRKLLGSGAFADVYEAIDDRDSNTIAIKVVPSILLKQTPKLDQLVRTQINVLKTCRSQNVIRFVDSWKTDQYIFIATEFCNGGDLEQYLKKKKKLSQDQSTRFLKQIMNGFKGLHEVGAMHRDFKVANVLLHNGVCKIADLGFAKQMQKQKMTGTILGTSLTMAPEVLEQKPYGFEADIWSLGVVFYQLLSGNYPYMGLNDMDILKKIKNNRPSFTGLNISENAIDFIDKCLTVDPKKRIKWVQLYSHPLLKSNNAGLIYGPLVSQIRVGDIKQFYEKNIYPEFNHKLNPQGFQFEQINSNNIRQSQNIAALQQRANQKKQKQQAFQRYENAYLNRRNDIMFIFKFVSPYVANFYNIKANHGIALFVLSKKAYLDIKKLITEMKDKKNIFKFQKYFNDFCNSNTYKSLLEQLNSDIQLIQVQCASYSADIQNCSKEIAAEFNVQKVVSKDFEKLVKQTIDQYWFLLADVMSDMKIQKRKQDLIRVLQALYYYKNNQAKSQQFDHEMAIIDFKTAQQGIMQKYMSIFN